MLTERHWWAILVDAEALAEAGGDNVLKAHELSGLARVKLRDEFGINLDTVWAEARPEFLRLLERER